MLSGRSTVVTAYNFDSLTWTLRQVLGLCHTRLGLAGGETTMELWYGSDKVPDDTSVIAWPGIKPPGKLSEYQL
eukprot:5689021-Amphidinium_carterae.1